MDKNIFPGWEIVELIGSGGFSKVYKIKKCDSGETDFFSALKIVEIPQSDEEYRSYRAEGYDDQTITGIFDAQAKDIIQEFELMHQFRGVANIVSFEDHLVVRKEDSIGWRILIRMELLTTLLEWYGKTEFSDSLVKQLGLDICHALKMCEKKNIVHRDIKPQNIFVNDFGDFKLGDFGVAKVMEHTTRATKIGTYSYMAPEVYNGQPYNHSSDIYSLGMTLYWLLNERRLPFVPLPPAVPTPSVNTEAHSRRLGGEAIPAPKYGSDELKAVVLKACAFNPKDRFSSVAEFENALHSAVTNGEVFNTVSTNAEPNFVTTEVSGNGRNFDNSSGINPQPPEENVAPKIDDEDKTHAVKRAPKSPEGNSETPSFGNKPKKSGKGRIIAIVAVLLLIVAAVASIFALSRNENDDDETSSKSHTSKTSSITESVETASSETESSESPEIAFSEGLGYTLLDDGTYEVSGIGYCKDKDIIIPAEYNGKPVTKIGNEAFNDCSSLTSITIPDGITSIGDYAFYECRSLKSIEIPNSVTSIGDWAFAWCESLTSIEIPNSVTSIGDSAFYGCESLTNVEIPNSVTSIGAYAFAWCESLKSIEIPNSVTSIGYSAFAYCESLTSIEIPNSVTSIGECAFYECSSLTSIEIPNSVTSIGNFAFEYCTSLTSIKIPNSVTSIGACAFYVCKSLTSIEIPNSVTTIGVDVFEWCDNLTDIYCEASSKPEGWDDEWLGNCTATVHWGQ